jgi:hypothetical protein
VTAAGDRAHAQSLLTRRAALPVALVIGAALGLAVWALLRRDPSEVACRRNLATLYVAAVQVTTGEAPEPPPAVKGADQPSSPAASSMPSVARCPALNEVFRKLVTDFWITPQEYCYVQRAQGLDCPTAVWFLRSASGRELVCPRDPSHDKISGYFALARSWTELTDLPPSSYEWNPEPRVMARCPWHHLRLMQDGSIRRD